MALRNTSRYLHLFSRRNYSGATKPLVNIAINEKTGVATATLQKPPVNSLNLELLTELKNTLKQAEENKCRGLILTSNSNTVFSAGLDILEMYKPDINRFKEFWMTLQETWIQLYGTSYPTVAVVNGHSPAGGCLLALSCEYRIMLNNFTIGLNETRLGIIAPTWFIASMRNVIGVRQAELALTTGNLFKTDEAFKIGLVDEVAASKEEAIAKAESFLERFALIPRVPRALTKKNIRSNDIQDLINNQTKDLEQVVNYVMQEKVQQGLELYMETLKQKQK